MYISVFGIAMLHYQGRGGVKALSQSHLPSLYTQLGIGICIEADATGIVIPAFGISDRYRRVPDWAPLFWYWTGSGISTNFHSGTRLTRC